MSRPLIVLKFGGSVLRDDNDLDGASHEVYRWIRLGWKVVAVVSAFEGETDRLLREAAHSSSEPLPEAVAMLVGTGELRSAARLAIQLDRAGVAVRVLDAAAIRLKTRGGLLDAGTRGVSVARIRAALRSTDVLVVPGFTGRDKAGRMTLLGRGGSDLTALSLARHLGARCRLIKDVDGLYEWDPGISGPRPRLFDSLTWHDARRLDGSIIQHKAVDAATRWGLEFEVASLHRAGASQVGDVAVEFSAETPSRPLRVALLGAGNVGGGVYHNLLRHPEWFEVCSVCVRQPARHQSIPASLLTSRLSELSPTRFDVIVDTSGDTAAGLLAARLALENRRAFVTANKVLVARHGEQLERAAKDFGSRFLYSASIGGAAPLLEGIQHWSAGRELVEWSGVLNGTTNFVLDQIASGNDWNAAVDLARQAGLAEADATADLSGADAACKLVILTHAVTGEWTPPTHIACEPLTAGHVDQARRAALRGSRLRQIARARRVHGKLRMNVGLTEVPADCIFGRCRRQWNVLVAKDAGGNVRAFRGKGAGRWPTAHSILADLFDLARQRRADSFRPAASAAESRSHLLAEVV